MKMIFFVVQCRFILIRKFITYHHIHVVKYIECVQSTVYTLRYKKMYTYRALLG